MIMEQTHRDLKVLKIFDFIFLIIALVLMGAVIWIGMQLATLPNIERHVDQMGVRMDNHETRLEKIEHKLPLENGDD